MWSSHSFVSSPPRLQRRDWGGRGTGAPRPRISPCDGRDDAHGRRGQAVPGPSSCARRRLEIARSTRFLCHLRTPRSWAVCIEPRGDAHLGPGPGVHSEEERRRDASRMPPCPPTPLWAWGSVKTLLNEAGRWRGEEWYVDNTATQDCDSRAVLAPPRPVISLPLPAGVNNSPGCQMQVMFVAAMKETERRGLIFGGQEEVWGIN